MKCLAIYLEQDVMSQRFVEWLSQEYRASFEHSQLELVQTPITDRGELGIAPIAELTEARCLIILPEANSAQYLRRVFEQLGRFQCEDRRQDMSDDALQELIKASLFIRIDDQRAKSNVRDVVKSLYQRSNRGLAFRMNDVFDVCEGRGGNFQWCDAFEHLLGRISAENKKTVRLLPEQMAIDRAPLAQQPVAGDWLHPVAVLSLVQQRVADRQVLVKLFVPSLCCLTFLTGRQFGYSQAGAAALTAFMVSGLAMLDSMVQRTLQYGRQVAQNLSESEVVQQLKLIPRNTNQVIRSSDDLVRSGRSELHTLVNNATRLTTIAERFVDVTLNDAVLQLITDSRSMTRSTTRLIQALEQEVHQTGGSFQRGIDGVTMNANRLTTGAGLVMTQARSSTQRLTDAGVRNMDTLTHATQQVLEELKVNMNRLVDQAEVLVNHHMRWLDELSDTVEQVLDRGLDEVREVRESMVELIRDARGVMRQQSQHLGELTQEVRNQIRDNGRESQRLIGSLRGTSERVADDIVGIARDANHSLGRLVNDLRGQVNRLNPTLRSRFDRALDILERGVMGDHFKPYADVHDNHAHVRASASICSIM